MARLLSGIKPTGNVHIGNYFGALRQFVELQDRYECFVFVPDLHALNQVQNAPELSANVRHVVVSYLAAGLDPQKVVLFRQSAVPAHAELCAIFNAMTSMGLLERAHAYKDAVAKDKPVTMGLFDYPVLMAADILLYHPEVVPVGKDQQQHLEIMADIAGRFNHLYGDYFQAPKGLILEETAVVPGLDGRKMSKSYDNVIGLFDESEILRKKVMGITTDSRRPEEPKDPQTDTVAALYRLVATPEESAGLERRYREGGIGYKEAKDLLAEKLESFVAPLRWRKAEIEARPGYIEEVLAAGAERARAVAEETLAETKRRVGLL